MVGLHGHHCCRRIGEAYTIYGYATGYVRRNVGTPYALPCQNSYEPRDKGKPIARKAHGHAGLAKTQKRTPFCNGTDRGSRFAPPRKRADGGVGAQSREKRENLERGKQMDKVNSAFASPDPVETWDQIEWKRCHDQVRRLQSRIVKATQ
jgi:hypothetical protein